MSLFVLFLALFAAEPAHAKGRVRMVYSCGCIDRFPGDPGFKVYADWVIQHAWDLEAAQQGAAVLCANRFGNAPVYNHCYQQPLSGKQLAFTEGKQRARLARERAAARTAEARERRGWEYNEKLRRDGMRRNNAVIDELKRRQRDDEIDRVLRRAREKGVR